MIDINYKKISISRQCELLNLCRSSYYYRSKQMESSYNLELMRLIDRRYLQCPFYGSRRMRAYLRREGHIVNRKRVGRLMNMMGLQVIYPRKRLSTADKEHRVFPYLLRGLRIDHVNHVWSTDITYIPMRKGFIYLAAIIDWYSRYVLSWEISLNLEKDFCISALEKALLISQPEIFNSDQGSQFTSLAFVAVLLDRGISVSMDGRGRVFDNIFIERLWRTVKYEEVYLKDYVDVKDAVRQLGDYFHFYNNERLHQSLGYKTPAEVYFQNGSNIPSVCVRVRTGGTHEEPEPGSLLCDKVDGKDRVFSELPGSISKRSY